MEAFGLFGFLLAILAWDRLRKVERILRENHIRPQGMTGLGGRLRERVGRTVTITLYAPDGSTTPCKVLDVDEEWARVLRNEGKKSQRELLIRLEDVRQIRD